jgi:3-dehydroquinate dehydratase
MMIVIAALSVALVCFILYALERRSKTEPINWMDAGKVTVIGGIITAAVVFATTTEVIADAVKAVDIPVVAAATQDMFVGKPSF